MLQELQPSLFHTNISAWQCRGNARINSMRSERWDDSRRERRGGVRIKMIVMLVMKMVDVDHTNDNVSDKNDDGDNNDDNGEDDKGNVD